MSEISLSTLREEAEEITAILAVMAQSFSEGEDDWVYRSIRAVYRKATALEAQINQLSTTPCKEK
ncbi:hypothetical protein [Pragia fontium]|uniref:hypothetical protein n=1 Tax=Pragia fontium TaxID=82985 RepID=UPI000649ADA6|nr:hypothetical protein [Pragia fontium]AKJ41526.1 hypothetical protein QQ39_05050 [Pragia fontium]